MTSVPTPSTAASPSRPLALFARKAKANAPWLALVAVLGLSPFLGYLFSGEILFASDQIGSPSWRFVFESLRSGHIPLWNPYHLAGTPIYDALAGDGSYPPFLLLGMLVPVENVVGLMFVLHTLLAGTFAYVLVRGHFRLDRFLSAALAVAYMLNTHFFSHIYSGHTGKFYVLSWLPLGLYFLLGALEKKAPWWKSVGLGLTVSAMVLTSHLQLTYYVLMGYFLYFAFRMGTALKQKALGEAAGVAAKFWAPILLGLGLCFPLIWGPYKYNQDYSVRGEGARQTYEHSTSWSMHPEETASLIVPEFGGINEKYWGRNPFKLNSEYPGIAVWFLGLVGLIAFRRAYFWLWGSVGLLAIIYGLGAHTPFFRLFYAVIPGIKSFRAPSMILFWLAAALLLMSAQTLRLLTVERSTLSLDAKRWNKNLLLAGAVTGGLLILAGLLQGVTYGLWNAFISPQDIPNFSRQTAASGTFTAGALRAGILVLALAFALRHLLFQKRDERSFAGALLAIVVIDLLSVDRHFVETYPLDRMFPHETTVDRLKADTSAYRVFSLPGANQRGYLQYHEIPSTDGWADQEYRLYRAYRGGDYQQNPTLMEGLRQNADGSVEGSKFLDMLNVKYLLYRLPDMPGLQMAENRSVLPRAYLVSSWESVPFDRQINRMRAPDFNPLRAALIDPSAGLAPRARFSDPAASPSSSNSAVLPDSLTKVDSANTQPRPAEAAAALGEITRLLASVNGGKYRVKVDKEALLVLSEVWIPYWTLKVNGKKQDLLRVNYLFRGVHLGPGEHSIDMEYVSQPLRQGLWVSLLAAFLLTTMGFILARLAKRQPPDASAAGS